MRKNVELNFQVPGNTQYIYLINNAVCLSLVTRTHSSRMRTTQWPSLLGTCVCLLVWRGVCLLIWGCLPHTLFTASPFHHTHPLYHTPIHHTTLPYHHTPTFTFSPHPLSPHTPLYPFTTPPFTAHPLHHTPFTTPPFTTLPTCEQNH